MTRVVRKWAFGHMQTVKLQVSLRIRAVWPEALLFALSYIKVYSLFAYVRWPIFSRRGSYITCIFSAYNASCCFSSNRPRRGRQPAIFVGGLPRSLRVSTFKTEVRGRDVDPLRVIWHGGNGHAFLQFDNDELMESALTALSELDINGKKLRVEAAHQGRRSQDQNGDVDDDSRREDVD